MSTSDLIQMLILIVTALFCVAGWWRNSTRESHDAGTEDGAVQTQLTGLEKNMESGFRAVYHRIDDIKASLLTCRQEETARLLNLEGRLDNHMNGGHLKDHSGVKT